MVTRNVDSRGRLALGKQFADRLVIIQELADGFLQIIPAEAIPAREVWLYKNPKALASVMRGLEQAMAGDSVPEPDLEADAKHLESAELKAV